MMTVTGTKDNSRRAKKDYRWCTDPFEGSPPGDKFLVIVQGADHGLGGVTGEESTYGWRVDPNQAQIVLDATTAFWDAYLKGNSQALTAITAGSKMSFGTARAAVSKK